jgi:hypothetical protein
MAAPSWIRQRIVVSVKVGRLAGRHPEVRIDLYRKADVGLDRWM